MATAFVTEDVKTPRTRKAPQPRKWVDVVLKIKEMAQQGEKVPDIADSLQLSYVLVNQVILQSYKMSVDTLNLFNRQELARLDAI